MSPSHSGPLSCPTACRVCRPAMSFAWRRRMCATNSLLIAWTYALRWANPAWFMVEHPKFSFLWFVTAWVEAESICDIYYQSHQSCAYGGEQPHWTCLAANFPHVCSVNQVCPGTHDHPTRGFVPRGHKRRAGPSCPTQYSRALCEAIVNAFLLALSPLGLRQGPLPLSANPAAQAATNLQPVKSRSPVFVPEYKCRLLALFDDSGACVWASAPCT